MPAASVPIMTQVPATRATQPRSATGRAQAFSSLRTAPLALRRLAVDKLRTSTALDPVTVEVLSLRGYQVWTLGCDGIQRGQPQTAPPHAPEALARVAGDRLD